jgi:hypothetical protein
MERRKSNYPRNPIGIFDDYSDYQILRFNKQDKASQALFYFRAFVGTFSDSFNS